MAATVNVLEPLLVPPPAEPGYEYHPSHTDPDGGHWQGPPVWVTLLFLVVAVADLAAVVAAYFLCG